MRYCDFQCNEDFQSIFGDFYSEEFWKIVYEEWEEKSVDQMPVAPRTLYHHMIPVITREYPDIPGENRAGCLHIFYPECNTWESYTDLWEIFNFIDDNFILTTEGFYKVYESIKKGKSVAYFYSHHRCEGVMA